MKRLSLLIGLFLLVLTACSPQAQTANPTDCSSPTLVIDKNTFQIKEIQLAPDGSVTLPSDEHGVIYWVNGTDLIFYFMLSPTPENLAIISAVKTGSTATATWSSCNSMTFNLSAPVPGSFSLTYLPEQTTTGISIYLQSDLPENSLVVNGEIIE